MATFPGSLKTWAALIDNSDAIVAAHPNERGDEIEALEIKVGADSSAVATSHDYKFTHLPAQVQNWDAGGVELRGLTLQSDIATSSGSPLTVASTTKVTNLNADYVDGKHVAGTNGAGEITTNDGAQTLTSKTLTSPVLNTPDLNAGTVDSITSLTISNAVDVGSFEIRALNFQSDIATSSGSPLTVVSTSVVTNLNSDKLDGADLDTTTTLGTSDSKVPSQKAVKTYVDNILSSVYPVGIVVTLGVSTNPNTLFGIGTWAAIAGKVIVGINAGDAEFDTLDEVGGDKSVTLTAAQSGLPAHNHLTFNNGNTNATLDSSNYPARTYIVSGDPYTDVRGQTGAPDVGKTSANSTAAASSSHTNLQPYIVKYVWQRTA